MQIKELTNEDAVKELKEKLPTLKRVDYDSIDHLMKKISKKHKITGNKLHNLFVSKYGHTPDHWIKKYREKLKEGNYGASTKEPNAPDYYVESEDKNLDVEAVKKFIQWTVHRLHLKGPMPKIILSDNTEKAQAGTHTGVHSEEDNTIWVYTGKRNLIDIFRTIFHELVHERQSQLNMIKPDDSYPGSPIEAMADMLAGKYIKIYGKHHPEIFQ